MSERESIISHQIKPNFQERQKAPEFLSPDKITILVFYLRENKDLANPSLQKQRRRGFIHSLALKAAILIPAVSYIACGGGGEKDNESQTFSFTHRPVPERKMNLDDGRFDSGKTEERVYTDTFRSPKEDLPKLIAEIEPHFQPQAKIIHQPMQEPPSSFVAPPEVMPGGHNKIILTFDDSDSSGVLIGQILDILAQYEAKAIFFPTGSWAQGNPIIQRMKDEGHLVGNHTFSHKDLTRLSPEEASAEIQGGAVGNSNLLRPPYGSGCSEGSGRSYIEPIAAGLGFQIFCWDIDTRDWARRYQGGAQEILNSVLTEIPKVLARQSSAVVLMHMHVENTVRALPQMLKSLKEAGYELHW